MERVIKDALLEFAGELSLDMIREKEEGSR